MKAEADMGCRHNLGGMRAGKCQPDEIQICVHDFIVNMRYMVLPLSPAGTAHLTEDQLAQLVTPDGPIGVALANAPARAV
jgi:hypothetical protein